ncbi:hypothetical protein [Endozoicomonas sp. 2B-B]
MSTLRMPANTGAGVYIGLFGFLVGFAFVWYLWWLAILAMVGAVTVLIVRSSNDHEEEIFTSEAVMAIESKRKAQLMSAESLSPRGGPV